MTKYLFALFTSLFLGVLILLAADVKVDYDHSANFSQYKTYSWIQVKAGDPLWHDRIMQAIDSELVSKGWSKVEGSGDAGVAAFGSTKEQPVIHTFYDSFGGGWYWNGFGDGMATTTVDRQPIGTLMVDVFDGHTKKLIWRGVASDALSDKPEKNEKKMEKAVGEMFKHFPPAPKG